MRVVIADDSALLREGLARLLTEAGFEVIGQARDGEELLAQVEAGRPDVAIVDIRMPPTHTDEGLRAARELRTRHPGMGVLVLSQYVRPSYALELLAGGAGGIGYLLKDRVADVEELTDSVRRVGEGGSVLDPAVVAQLVDRRRAGDDPVERLTTREREVLTLMAEGGRTRRSRHGCSSPSTPSRSTSRTSSPSWTSSKAPMTTDGSLRSWPSSVRSSPGVCVSNVFYRLA